jgi:serine/threonine-protein kinase
VLPLRPELFGDFLLVQRLGKSAMAEVLLGVRLGDRSGRAFAIKRPLLGERASGAAAQAIAREAEVLEAVRCDGLVRLEAAGEIAGLPYVATELVRGVALDALLSAGALPAPATAAIARDLAAALAALHAAGWVHGDVTPSNVLVDDAGDARLVDLAIAERAGAAPPRLAGKPGYVAPEAVRGVPVDPALDVYAWGVVVAECALGARLHADRELVDAAARPDATPRRAELGELADVVAAALRREPSARPAARELVERLGGAEVDRGLLAERVAAATSGDAPPAAEPSAQVAVPAAVAEPSAPRALTPTVPMVVPTLAAPTLVDEPDAALARRPLPPPRRIGPPRPSPWAGLVVAVAAALVLGMAAVRLARPRQATLSLAAPLPRRSVIEIDGKPTMAPETGGTLQLPPGRHLVSLVLPRNERREYSIDVRAGDRVLVFPLLRGSPGASSTEGRGP